MFTLLIIACSTEETPVAPVIPEVILEAPVQAEVAPEPGADGWTWYGQAVEATGAVAAKDLLADPARYTDQEILIQGRVTEVCQKKGCWMVIAEGDQTLRVMMKDHAFSVDMAGAGNDCLVQGTVTAKPVDPAFVEHLAGESLHPDKMPEAGKEAGSIVYQVEATGVAFKAPEA